MMDRTYASHPRVQRLTQKNYGCNLRFFAQCKRMWSAIDGMIVCLRIRPKFTTMEECVVGNFCRLTSLEEYDLSVN